MADDAATTSAEETQVTFNVKSANDQKFVITVPASSTVADLKTKLSGSEFADIPPERQRLIYSGRVLKDPDTLSSVKIKDGHTVHLVKGAASNARQNPANQGSGSSAAGSGTAPPQVPTNLATGTGNNPLAGLTGARYAGFHGLPGADMFGADGGMGAPPDPSQLLEMMENPMFLSQMNEAMNNPAVVEMMTNSPMIRNNPMLANMLRDPNTRRMLFNPEMMRMQLQMQQAMGGGDGGQRMAAPGVTDTTPQPSSTATGDGSTATPNQPNTTGPTQQQNPFAALLGGAGGAGGANPWGSPADIAALPQNQAWLQSQGQNTSSSTGTGATGTQGSQNPFGGLFGASAGAGGQDQGNPLAEMTRQMMQNPEMMRNAMNMMSQMQGSGGGGFPPFGANPSNQDASAGTTGANSPPAANPFGSLFGPGGFGGAAGGFGAPPPPQETRPPEEVYESQLRQLNEMGFFEFDRNVSALRRSGGNVQGAIDYLLGGGT
jgi:ubiquilin